MHNPRKYQHLVIFDWSCCWMFVMTRRGAAWNEVNIRSEVKLPVYDCRSNLFARSPQVRGHRWGHTEN